MKRSEMEDFLSVELDNYISLHGGYEETVPGGKLLLEKIIALGFKPPAIKINTPRGPRMWFYTNEFEEDAQYDEYGHRIGENDEKE